MIGSRAIHPRRKQGWSGWDKMCEAKITYRRQRGSKETHEEVAKGGKERKIEKVLGRRTAWEKNV